MEKEAGNQEVKLNTCLYFNRPESLTGQGALYRTRKKYIF